MKFVRLHFIYLCVYFYIYAKLEKVTECTRYVKRNIQKYSRHYYN